MLVCALHQRRFAVIAGGESPVPLGFPIFHAMDTTMIEWEHELSECTQYT